MPRRIGLLLKRDKPEARDVVAELTPYLLDRGHEVYALVEEGDSAAAKRDALAGVEGLRFVEERDAQGVVELLVVLGGDGTILRGASLVSDSGVPIVGLNLGTLGFLSTAPPEHARDTVQRALDGVLPIEQRLRLRCEVQLASGEVVVRHAANDAVVSQGALARLIELDVTVDEVPITRYRADGLIVATPTGSTAYNLAAGGPIVAPDVNAVVLTPICPHTLTNRPLVLPSTARIAIRLHGAAEHVVLTVDGQWGQRIGQGDTVRLSQGTPPMFLYRGDKGHFAVLREKLRWGE